MKKYLLFILLLVSSISNAQSRYQLIPEIRAQFSYNNGYNFDIGANAFLYNMEPIPNGIMVGTLIGFNISHYYYHLVFESNINITLISIGLEIPVWGNGHAFALGITPKLALSAMSGAEIGGGYTFCINNTIDRELNFTSPLLFINASFPSPLFLLINID